MAIKGYNFYEERPVMFHFYTQKKLGGKVGREQLTYSVLKELWAEEMVSDKDISNLFSISQSEVRDMREEFGLTHYNAVKECTERAFSVLGEIGASIMLA